MFVKHLICQACGDNYAYNSGTIPLEEIAGNSYHSKLRPIEHQRTPSQSPARKQYTIHRSFKAFMSLILFAAIKSTMACLTTELIPPYPSRRRRRLLRRPVGRNFSTSGLGNRLWSMRCIQVRTSAFSALLRRHIGGGILLYAQSSQEVRLGGSDRSFLRCPWRDSARKMPRPCPCQTAQQNPSNPTRSSRLPPEWHRISDQLEAIMKRPSHT